jgi:hypothetical protein
MPKYTRYDQPITRPRMMATPKRRIPWGLWLIVIAPVVLLGGLLAYGTMTGLLP